jgi:hypothetical protein
MLFIHRKIRKQATCDCEVWADKTSLTPPHRIEMSVPNQERDQTTIDGEQ